MYQYVKYKYLCTIHPYTAPARPANLQLMVISSTALKVTWQVCKVCRISNTICDYFIAALPVPFL